MSLKTYNISEAAEALHISDRSVYEYIYQGFLKAAKIGGKWLIKEEWLSAFIDSSIKEAVNA
jgi:excisionase family DNA binding protein